METRHWILENMREMPVIDTHEHLESESARLADRRDFIALYMTHYASTDVMLAGLSAEKMALLQGNSLDVREKWDILKPYWELCRNTAYFRALERANADLCWVHIISQEYAVRVLEEMLEVLPSNKILGFGGDYIFVEGTYAHLQFAKEKVAEVLANRIEKGRLNKADAVVLTEQLLHDNAEALFGG
ncbi:MAG: hypothetical protein JW969_09665 [Spirochaetales bacterium]|nr:hypothetical protein [Spirochaetales bacterium]